MPGSLRGMDTMGSFRQGGVWGCWGPLWGWRPGCPLWGGGEQMPGSLAGGSMGGRWFWRADTWVPGAECPPTPRCPLPGLAWSPSVMPTSTQAASPRTWGRRWSSSSPSMAASSPPASSSTRSQMRPDAWVPPREGSCPDAWVPSRVYGAGERFLDPVGGQGSVCGGIPLTPGSRRRV